MWGDAPKKDINQKGILLLDTVPFRLLKVKISLEFHFLIKPYIIRQKDRTIRFTFST